MAESISTHQQKPCDRSFFLDEGVIRLSFARGVVKSDARDVLRACVLNTLVIARGSKKSLENVRGKIARELFRIQNRINSFSFFITQIIVNNILLSLTSP